MNGPTAAQRALTSLSMQHLASMRLPTASAIPVVPRKPLWRMSHYQRKLAREWWRRKHYQPRYRMKPIKYITLENAWWRK